MVRELDIRYAQGWLLGRPEEALLTELTQPLRDSLRVRTPTPLANARRAAPPPA